MLEENFPRKDKIISRNTFVSMFVMVNTLVWYLYAFNFLNEIIQNSNLTYMETVKCWFPNFIGATVSALIGASFVSKIRKRVSFLYFWMFLGVISSIIPVVTLSNIPVISLLFGISFGLGMPVCLGYYVDYTDIEKRALLSGIILFVSSVGTVLLAIAQSVSILANTLILAVWRAAGLVIFFLLQPKEKLSDTSKDFSYVEILTQKSFLSYFLPWIMFSLINYLALPVEFSILGEDSARFLGVIESVLINCSAMVAGFLSDNIGRKRVVIAGFVTLGIGYAVLGMYPRNLLSWYLYTVIDGAAWGIFYTIFILTLWGDISNGVSSDKYYAIGGIPFFLSNFIRFILTQYIVEAVPDYAIFSFVAFFMFLAVIPLMFAPETLPEKKLRERELRQYIEKAKKIKEKYA
ncbi:MAG: MFS transporter [Fervidobacterium sp.]